MYDGPKIIGGLIFFLAFASIPLWYTTASGQPYEKPDITLPKGECVESADYMRASHMELLNNWRDQVVRNGNREYISESGKHYQISLTNTCLTCHGEAANRKLNADGTKESAADAFCLRCHEKAGVEVDCWGCHLQSPEGM